MSLSDARRQLNIPKGTCPSEAAVKPQGPAGGPSAPPAQAEEASRGGGGSDLLEKVLARENMLAR